MATAIITGGTRGIGKALVYKFASQGFNIATCARTEAEVCELSYDLKKKFPSIQILALPGDVSNKEQTKNFGEQALSTFGKIDVLINNAGIFIPGSLLNETDGNFELMIQTNLASAYHLTRVIAPNMISNCSGYIFNICSTASIMAYANGSSYCISKFGLLGLTKVLREELKPYNIRVSAVLPGPTDTSSWEGSTLPSSRFMDPNEVAHLIYQFYNTTDNLVVEEILIRPMQGDIH